MRHSACLGGLPNVLGDMDTCAKEKKNAVPLEAKVGVANGRELMTALHIRSWRM